MRRQGITRRDFMKGAAAGAVGVAAVGVLGACSTPSDKETTTNAPETSTEDTGANKPSGPVDGKYVTKAMGHEDFIHVLTTFKEGKITECRVLAHEETMGIGNYACNRIPAEILKHQSVEVPNVRGCSISSNAIKMAVREAIELAGYKVEDFSTKIPKVVEDKAIVEECDVVIMGAGTAGLMAANRLLDLGKKVIVLEKRDIPGGSMPMTYGGLLNTGSEMMKKAFPKTYAAQADAEAYVKYWQSERFAYLFHKEYDRFNNNTPYLHSWMTNSGKMLDYMGSIGMAFAPMGKYEQGITYGTTVYLAPGCYEGGSGYGAMYLAQRITEMGGTLYYNAKVTELKQDASGKVYGLKAETADADQGKTTYDITAKATLLASGGFQKNVEMLEKYVPELADQFFNCASCSTGDGIQLGLKAGGVVECADGRPLPAYLSSYNRKFELAFIHYSTPGIMVNAKGEEFGNINSQNHQLMASCKIDEANGDVFYYIFDESGVPGTKDYTAYGFDGYTSIFDSGECVHYDTVKACADACNLPNLVATIEANNACAAKGEKNKWGATCPMIDTRNGIWAIQVDPTYYLTVAGLQIDPQGHVTKGDYAEHWQDGGWTIIPGLYAAGDVCGSTEEKDGKQYGMGFDCALTYGFIAANTIDKDLAE